MNYSISVRKGIGKNYDEFGTLPFFIGAMKTGKSAKKSTVVAKKILKKLLQDPTANAICLKKLMKDHVNTTIRSFEKAFNSLQQLTGYNWRNDGEIAASIATPRITNNKTGQQIIFCSFDRPDSLGGIELVDPRFYFAALGFEEPLQISAMIKEIDEAQEQRNFDLILNSAFRQKLADHQHQQIFLTFNDWSKGDHGIIRRYIKKYISEDSEILDKKGKMVIYDPAAEEGRGIFVMVASGGINEFNTPEFINIIKRIKRDDPEFYKAIWLGTAANFAGNAYSPGNLRKIKGIENISEIEKCDLWRVGIDYSSVKDYTVVLLQAINSETKDVYVVDGWRYSRTRAKIPMSEIQMVDKITEILKNGVSDHNLKSKLKKAKIFIDSRESLLKAIITKKMAEDKILLLDYMLPKPAAKFNSSSSFVRVMCTRYIMSDGRIHIAKDLQWLLEEFRARTILKDGAMKDGGDDGPQTFEYGLSDLGKILVPKKIHDQIIQMYLDRLKIVKIKEGQ